MIITRSPLRITFGGGGTDLPSYYEKYGGFLVAGAINQYVYTTVMRPFTPGIYLKYSKLERVDRVDEVQHPIIREALRLFPGNPPQIEITTLADIPAGTGLGSSGSFTTALLKALFLFQRHLLLPDELARLACQIEIERLREPVGKQDQYIAAYGGLTCFTFHPDGQVQAEPLHASTDTLFELEDHLLLFFTGYSRSAGSILKDQDQRTQESDEEVLQNLHQIKELGQRSRVVLEKGDLGQFAELMTEQWQQKRRRSAGMSSAQIDEFFELGLKNGAIGGKLVGAGGGGFLLFFSEDNSRLRSAFNRAGLNEVRFQFDFEGTKGIGA